MKTLLIPLAGPMQSWGTSSRFSLRETGRDPSKSGVIGMLCAALGRRRDEPVDDLAGLEMAVRVDRPGTIERDFQTALGVRSAGGGAGQTVISQRYYLSDAAFLVGLRGEAALVEEAHAALKRPRWPLFLGRKGYVPGVSPYVPDGVVSEGLLEALGRYPWPGGRGGPGELEVVVEDDDGEVRTDVPVSFKNGDRRFAARRVRRISLARPEGSP